MGTGRTHGGARSKSFSWEWDGATLWIRRQNGRLEDFALGELVEILKSLEDQFGSGSFPLANDVEKMWNGTEKPGLGMTILAIRPRDRWHAQASSYLGVVFEQLELATWNGKSRGIEWCLSGAAPTAKDLAASLRESG